MIESDMQLRNVTFENRKSRRALHASRKAKASCMHARCFARAARPRFTKIRFLRPRGNAPLRWYIADRARWSRETTRQGRPADIADAHLVGLIAGGLIFAFSRVAHAHGCIRTDVYACMRVCSTGARKNPRNARYTRETSSFVVVIGKRGNCAS